MTNMEHEPSAAELAARRVLSDGVSVARTHPGMSQADRVELVREMESVINAPPGTATRRTAV